MTPALAREGLPLLPSHVAEAVYTRARSTSPGLAALVFVLVTGFVWPFLGLVAYASYLLLLGVAAWEVNRVVRRREMPRHSWLHPRRLVAGAVLLCFIVAIVLGMGFHLWTIVLSLLGVEALLRGVNGTDSDTGRWYAHGRLVTSLMESGILPKRKAEDAPWTLHYRGRHHTVKDDDGKPVGESVTIELPSGYVAADVAAKRERFAGCLGFAPRRVWIDHDPDDSPRCVTIGVAAERQGGAIVPSPLGDRDRTVWREPFRIGQDVRGHAVYLATDAVNDLFGGIPGSGKTSLVRIELAHYLLDPATTVYGCDGKGSRKDYAAVSALARLWVWGTDPDPATDLLTLLREVHEIVQHRNTISDREPAGGWPGVLVLLEELQEIRAAATTAQRVELDVLLGRVIRLGRAVAVKIVVSTQRPVKDDVPSGVRNLVAQNICLRVRGTEDSRIVLGTTPTLPLPTRPGEAIVSTDSGQAAVDLDFLDLSTFAAVCERARQLREAEPAAPLLPQNEPDVFAALLAPSADPLADAVRSLLEIRPMTATQMYEAIDPALRPVDAQALGRACAKVAGIVRTRVTVNGKSNPGWTLAVAGQSPRPEPSPDRVYAHDPGSYEIPSDLRPTAEALP